MLKKTCSAQLTKPQSSQSIPESDGIYINLTRLGPCRGTYNTINSNLILFLLFFHILIIYKPFD